MQCDEIRSCVGAKHKNVSGARKHEHGIGDVYTWIALDPDSKLVITWRVGQRTANDAERFMRDLARRLANRVQLTTDGYSPYVPAVFFAFGKDGVDFAQIVKEYARAQRNEERYSPSDIVKSEKHVVFGTPVTNDICTSHVERQNLTMRMTMRRMTRLTNAFSKKIVGHENAVALHFMHYNFCRPHQTLASPYLTTPTMAAAVSDHVWKVSEIVALIEAREKLATAS